MSAHDERTETRSAPAAATRGATPLKGIKRDRWGWRVYVKVAGQQKEHRYPADTALETMQAKRDEMRLALRRRAGFIARRKGTLKADAKRYLDQHKPPVLVRSSYRSRICEIEAWFDTFGDFPRFKITRAMILEERGRWLAAGLAPKTCNHRVRALRHLYRYLDGRAAPTPCDDIPKLKEPDAQPIFVSVTVVKRVAAKLTDPRTRGRFMVLASTGQRPAQLKRAQPTDLDLRRRVWMVRPAKGGHAIPVILTDDMVVAWKAFKAADGWGEFDGSDYAKQLYAAGWPRHIRPYNAKHTVAIALGEAGAEWEDIKDWLGHKDVKSTRIYTGHILARTRATAKRLAGRIGW